MKYAMNQKLIGNYNANYKIDYHDLNYLKKS